MTGLGERLKEARIAKGLTLDDLQEMTKIQKRYLAGIEEEDYSKMPGAFYVRAFIKQYAEAVDLDPDEVLAMYRESSKEEVEQKEEDQQVVTEPLQKPSRLQSNDALRELLPKVAVAFGIVVIVVIIYFVYKAATDQPPKETDLNSGKEVQVEQPEQKEEPKEQPVVEEPKEEPKELEEPEEPENTSGKLELVSTVGETSTYRLTDATTFNITIRTSNDSWIGVTDENGAEHLPEGARVLTNGDEVEVDMTGKERARIRVGRSEATEILINGEPFTFPTDVVTQNIIIEHEPSPEQVEEE